MIKNIKIGGREGGADFTRASVNRKASNTSLLGRVCIGYVQVPQVATGADWLS